MEMDHKKLNYFLLGALALTLAGSAYGYASASENKNGSQACACTSENRPVQTNEERALHETERINDLASVTGLSTDIIKTAFDAGKGIGEILKENNLDTDAIRTTLQTTMQERMRAHLAEEVADGTITQTQADERLAHAPEKGPGFGERKGPRDGRGPMNTTEATSTENNS